MKKLVVLSLLVIFTACNTAEKIPAIFNDVISKDNLLELYSKIQNDKSISAEQIEVLNRGISRLAVNNNDTLVGMTLGKVFEYQKDFAKEQALNSLEENVVKVGLILNHKFKYVGLVPQQDTLDFIVYEITNTSGKDIKNITGVLQFYDQQNNLVKQYPLRADIGMQDDKIIKTGETERITLPYIHDKANIRDSIMRSGKQFRTIWQPRGILFSDESRISMDDIN